MRASSRAREVDSWLARWKRVRYYTRMAVAVAVAVAGAGASGSDSGSGGINVCGVGVERKEGRR